MKSHNKNATEMEQDPPYTPRVFATSRARKQFHDFTACDTQ